MRYGLTSLLAPRVAALAGPCRKQVCENMIVLTGIEGVALNSRVSRLVLSTTFCVRAVRPLSSGFGLFLRRGTWVGHGRSCLGLGKRNATPSLMGGPAREIRGARVLLQCTFAEAQFGLVRFFPF